MALPISQVISVVGSLFKFAAKPLTKLVTAIPEGHATGVGAIVTALGGAALLVSPHVVTDQNIVAILKTIAEIITAIGGIIASMGAMRHELAAGTAGPGV